MKEASKGLEGDLKGLHLRKALRELEQGGLKGASRRLEVFSAEGRLEEGLKSFMFRRLEGGLIRNRLLRYIFYTCPSLM